MAKAHVITWKSIVMEEWLVEGAANAVEARKAFKDGEGRLVSRSDFDTGVMRAVRLADEADIDGANLQSVNQPE